VPVISLANYRADQAKLTEHLPCTLWSSRIQTLENNRAKIYLTFYVWLESQGGYILELHRDPTGWTVDSETFSQTGT
jgi:hypothetical protein